MRRSRPISLSILPDVELETGNRATLVLKAYPKSLRVEAACAVENIFSKRIGSPDMERPKHILAVDDPSG
jgi:hypothetical protein